MNSLGCLDRLRSREPQLRERHKRLKSEWHPIGPYPRKPLKNLKLHVVRVCPLLEIQDYVDTTVMFCADVHNQWSSSCSSVFCISIGIIDKSQSGPICCDGPYTSYTATRVHEPASPKEETEPPIQAPSRRTKLLHSSLSQLQTPLAWSCCGCAAGNLGRTSGGAPNVVFHVSWGGLLEAVSSKDLSQRKKGSKRYRFTKRPLQKELCKAQDVKVKVVEVPKPHANSDAFRNIQDSWNRSPNTVHPFFAARHTACELDAICSTLSTNCFALKARLVPREFCLQGLQFFLSRPWGHPAPWPPNNLIQGVYIYKII